LKITILGTGAAEGIPAPFCECPTCVHARAAGGRNVRKRTAALINDDLLIDCGPDLTASTQQLGVSLSDISTLLVTHSHGDHWYPFNLMMRLPGFCPIPPSPLQVYGPGPVSASLRRTKMWPELTVHGALSLQTVRAGKRWRSGNYWLTAVPANHAGGEAALLYIIDDGVSKLFYATDTGPLTDQAWGYVAREAPFDAVLMDETMGSSAYSEHQSMRSFLIDHDRFIKEGWLTDGAQFAALHFSHQSNPPHNDLVAFFAPHEVLVAYDGMVINL